MIELTKENVVSVQSMTKLPAPGEYTGEYSGYAVEFVDINADKWLINTNKGIRGINYIVKVTVDDQGQVVSIKDYTWD